MQNEAKKDTDTGRARKNSYGTAEKNFTKPRTGHFGVLRRSLKEFVCIYYRKNVCTECDKSKETSRTAYNPPSVNDNSGMLVPNHSSVAPNVRD